MNPDDIQALVDVKHITSFASDVVCADESAAGPTARFFRAKSAGDVAFVTAFGTRVIPMANEEPIVLQFTKILSSGTTVTAGVIGW